jgi:hypothetical protein
VLIISGIIIILMSYKSMNNYLKLAIFHPLLLSSIFSIKFGNLLYGFPFHYIIFHLYYIIFHLYYIVSHVH